MEDVGKTFSLRGQVTLLFVLLMVTVGALLVSYNHLQNRKILLSASTNLFDAVVQELLASFSGTHRPAAILVSLLAHSSIASADTLEERQKSLPLLKEALLRQPHLVAIQAGYANGDYFILRKLTEAAQRRKFRSPAQALFVADDIERDARGRRQLVRIHYDSDMHQLKRETIDNPAYDPRRRNWYRLAKKKGCPVLSPPYLYYFIGKVGVTLACRSAGGTVLAADATLDALSKTLASHAISPSTELLLFTGTGEVIAYREPERLTVAEKGGKFRIARIDELGNPLLAAAAPLLLRASSGEPLRFRFGDAVWIGQVRKLRSGAAMDLRLAVVSPEKELLGEAYRIATRSSLAAAAMVILSLPLVGLFAHSISRPMRRLAAETTRIRRLDFGAPVAVDSRVREVRHLAHAMDAMRETINRFLHLIASLTAEQDFNRMLALFTQETREASGVQAAGVFLLDEDRRRLVCAGWSAVGPNWCEHPDSLPLKNPESEPFRKVLEKKHSQLLCLKTRKIGWFGTLHDTDAESFLEVALLPLVNRNGESMGVVALFASGEPKNRFRTEPSQWQHFISILSGFAAVSLETKQLLKARKELLDGFIEVIASAIDAKSPYTGAHCQRVPVLTQMIDEAAACSEDPPFRNYRPTDADREALHIAAWLHDCGKVTTPEHVVDKATRLETLYDRIHEIRMRFEVLKRDAWIDHWRAVAEGAPESESRRRLEERLTELDEEFAFVAECNSGDTEMTPERVAKLHRIARRTWLRTLDDTLGISWEELKRKQADPAHKERLPVAEPLLADREEHRIAWQPGQLPPENGRWRFHMKAPRNRFDHGELHNLTVERGTLTPEERYLINQHIVQTILMLDRLPYPRHLRQVPEIAGGHHEHMDGTGYPRRLKRDEMPLQARMMAIADIFEALTASDRPYKKPKKLSEAVRILWFMKQEGHIDPDLFELFLRSGVHRRYAEAYLQPEQIDEVNLDLYLRRNRG